MKKLCILIIGLIMMFSLSSCETYTYATTQDDIYVEASTDVVFSDVNFNIVVRYGTPIYYQGNILYYIYNGLYYYPYFYNDYMYVRVYNRPFNHLNYRPYFRPHKYDYRFRHNDYRRFYPQHQNRHYNNPPHNTRPNVHNPQHHNQRPNINRPQQNRPPQKIDRNQNNHHGHRNMGGKR